MYVGEIIIGKMKNNDAIAISLIPFYFLFICIAHLPFSSVLNSKENKYLNCYYNS